MLGSFWYAEPRPVPSDAMATRITGALLSWGRRNSSLKMTSSSSWASLLAPVLGPTVARPFWEPVGAGSALHRPNSQRSDDREQRNRRLVTEEGICKPREDLVKHTLG
jgi:hypothetical protein